MKKLNYVFIGLGVFFVTLACSESSDKSNEIVNQEVGVVKDISAEEFKKLISEESIVLDVRTQKEFQSGHLENAVNLDFFSDNFLEKALELNKEKTLLIYCASGGRSGRAMGKLKDKGFKAVYNLIGGIGAWKGKGFSVVK